MGAAIYTSTDDVMSEAQKFDSDFHNFREEVNGNPIAANRLYEKYPPGERSHWEAFKSNFSSLVWDWDGDPKVDEKFESPTAEQLGYYRLLKTMWSAGSSEMARIKEFEARLGQLIAQYKSLGQTLFNEPVKPPKDPAAVPWPVGTILMAIGGVLAAVGLGYAGFQVWKIKRFTEPTSKVPRMLGQMSEMEKV